MNVHMKAALVGHDTDVCDGYEVCVCIDTKAHKYMLLSVKLMRVE